VIKEQALYKFVEDRRQAGFVWGVNDCNILCLSWLDILTGANTVDLLKGKYKTALGAAKYQVKYGQRLIEGIKAHGGVEIEPGFQQEGDFIISHGKKWDCGHICLGKYLLSAGPESGCTIYKLDTFIGYTVLRVETCHK